MKNIFLTITCLGILITSIWGQSPEAINYQAVVSGSNGNLIVNQLVNFRISILQGSSTGSLVYSETHLKTTNQYGAVTLSIGAGTLLFGTFSTINWGNGTYYLKTELDTSGGTNFQFMGVSQFLSVPYSLYAKSAGNAFPSGINGQTLRSDGNSWVPSSNLFNDGSKIGIGTTSPTNSAIFEVKSTTKGFLPPRMTHAELIAIANPSAGLMVYCIDKQSIYLFNGSSWKQIEGIIPCMVQNQLDTLSGSPGEMVFNTTTNCLNVSSGSAWYSICGTCTPQPTQATSGPDQEVLSGTVIQLAGNTVNGNLPPYGTGTWSIAIGPPGTFSNIHSPTSTFTGSGSAYVLRWTITTICGSTYDEVYINYLEICPSTFTDPRNGEVYPITTIGGQCWMAKNLNYNPPGSEDWCYNNDPSNCIVYGRIYTWDAMMNGSASSNSNPSNVQGVCPIGWHCPSQAEWDAFAIAIGNDGGSLKETGLIHWNTPNTGATNSTNFTALGGGYRDQNGTFFSEKQIAYFWSTTDVSSPSSPNTRSTRRLNYNNTNFQNINLGNLYGCSVRCVKD